MKKVERYNSSMDNNGYTYDCLKMIVDYEGKKITTCIFPDEEAMLLVIWDYGNFDFDYTGRLLHLDTSPDFIPVAKYIFSKIEKDDLDDFKRWMHENQVQYIESCLDSEIRKIEDAQDEIKEHTRYKRKYEKDLALLKAIPDSVIISGEK